MRKLSLELLLYSPYTLFMSGVHIKVSHSLCSRCMGIYMDTLNIFMRLVMILANGGGGRRK